MSSAYGAISRPAASTLDPLPLPLVAKLPTTNATTKLVSVDKSNNDLVETLRGLLNLEILNGSTYPQENGLDRAQFEAYFLSYDAFVLIRDSDQAVLGTFYVKPNYPGRCSHICNAGFLVMPEFRNLGIGKVLCEAFLILAPKLGYLSSVFNLVFENNTASVRLWRSYGFEEVGRIPKAGRLKNSVERIDAIVFYCDFEALDLTGRLHYVEL
ncbi:hypothetical protein SmJEL517_g04122 [Synchytrium microbalum]|uniref:N-acetyltransferase domain-containing protein n=1 Tax=Synchytrium microbalum TaxID=1806994 RepID=A0A507C4D0_9FUNG|nr:uncharacterized protein SmJEL517_g04122 [Synchytrium microbalum]TPX32846.1 hypothetical protein SmJEL517_g04122 [Synchytrium microbalum]